MRNALLLLVICFATAVRAMDSLSPEEAQAYQAKRAALLKQRVKADPQAEIPLTLSDKTAVIEFVIPERGYCSFKWGGVWSNSDTPMYNECFAEELAPFVLGNRDLNELDSCLKRYPGVNSDEIHRLVREIRDHTQQPSRRAENLRDFVIHDSDQDNAIQNKFSPHTMRLMQYTGVAIVISCAVVGVAYAVYKKFFEKSVIDTESEVDEAEKELQHDNQDGIDSVV